MLLRSVLFSLSVVIAGLLPLVGCEDEEFLPHRCGERFAGDTCHTVQPRDIAGSSAAATRDGGSVSEPEKDTRSSERQDAGAAHQDAFPKTPHCAAPTHFFSPACASRSFDPESFATRINAGCYRQCTRPRDPTCGGGTRCGRAGIAPLLCSGSSCTAICAEAWLCLPNSYFEPLPPDGDAGVIDWPEADGGPLSPPFIDDAGM